MYILVVQLSKLNDHLSYTIYNNQLKNGNNTKQQQQQQQQQQGNDKLSHYHNRVIKQTSLYRTHYRLIIRVNKR